MKKILLMIVGVALAAPFFVSAQVVPTTDQFTGAQTTCIDLQYNMSYRSRDARTNGEVSDLQDFLNTNGYLSSEPTGYFGLATVSAVKKFQSAAGVGSPTTPGYGGVGPKSRSKIKEMTCGSSVPYTGNLPLPQTTAVTPTTWTTPTTVTTSPFLVGCGSMVGFSTVTGNRCYTPVPLPQVYSNLPYGCTSATGFSSTTGNPCSWVTTPISTNASAYSILNISGNQSSYAPNSLVSLQVKSVGGEGDGMPASSDKGYNVQAYIFPASDTNFSNYLLPNPTYSYNGTYSSGLWNVQMNAPTPPGSYNLRVVLYCSKFASTCYNAGGHGVESVKILPFVVQNVTTTSASAIEVIGTPTLSLQYDSAQKESALTASYMVKVTASSGSNFKLYKYGAFDNDTYAFMVTLNNAKDANSSTVNPAYYQTSSNAVDNGTYWAIPAGQTASFSLSAPLSNPKGLFAGNYNATLSLYKPAGGSGAASSIVNSTTNTVSVVGETSPYISSASSFTNTNGYVITTITGVRFNQASNIVDIGGKKLDMQSVNNGTVIQFIPEAFGVTPGNYVVQVTHPTTGASNKVNVNIGAPAAALTVESVGTPTLSLQYDSAQKESSLVANYTVKITAGIQALSFPSYFVNCGGGSPVTINITNSSGQEAPMTPCVNGPATILSGTSATYTIKLTANPNQIFAGSYTATLWPKLSSLDLTTGQWMTTPLPTPILVGTAKTNTVTVVGERAPLITSALIGATGSVELVAYRLTFANNAVSFNGKTIEMPATPSGSLWVMNLKPSDFGITTSGMYSLQISTLEGASNMVNVNVIVAASTPAPTVTFTASPTSIASGQTSVLSWNSTDATSCTSSGDGASWGWPSARYITGAQYTPALTATQTYTMSCTGAGGTVSKSITVTVAAAISPLTVVTPNGGEMLTSGQTYGISWTGGDSAVDVYLLDDPSRLGKKIFSGMANNGYASWVATSLSSADLLNPTTGTYGTPSGKYVIWVGCTDNKCTVDNSNSWFSIVSTTASSTTASVQYSNQYASVIGAFSQAPTQAAPVPVSVWAYTWNRNLEVGSLYTEDVRALQTALTKEGVYTGEVTGGFYTQTYLSVKALQTKYGIEATGFVGPMTREKLNELY